jgi:magnesium and cobalt transporter
LVLAGFGRLPKKGENIHYQHYQFTVLRADSRRIHTLLVEPDRTHRIQLP